MAKQDTWGMDSNHLISDDMAMRAINDIGASWQDYINANSDLSAAGIDTMGEALRHYATHGHAENRALAPSPPAVATPSTTGTGVVNIDASQLSGAAPSGPASMTVAPSPPPPPPPPPAAPYNHVTSNPSEQGPGLTHFDPVAYLNANPDVAQAEQWLGDEFDPLSHFLNYGQGEGRDGLGGGQVPRRGAYAGFDPQFYANRVGLDATGLSDADIFRHLMNDRGDGGPAFAFKGGPSDFSEADYLEANPDVAAAIQSGQFASGLAHYNYFGEDEGRVYDVTHDLPAGPQLPGTFPTSPSGRTNTDPDTGEARTHRPYEPISFGDSIHRADEDGRRLYNQSQGIATARDAQGNDTGLMYGTPGAGGEADFFPTDNTNRYRFEFVRDGVVQNPLADPDSPSASNTGFQYGEFAEGYEAPTDFNPFAYYAGRGDLQGTADQHFTGDIAGNEAAFWRSKFASLGMDYDALIAAGDREDFLSAFAWAHQNEDPHAPVAFNEQGLPSDFSAATYLALNPDLQAAGLDEAGAAQHFKMFGQFEYRPYRNA
ncbi:MAG: hypothetical protein NXI16_01205 [Alphaproteobacteria bacterium]|nr:hypothetical protein [Alphaproteobacteria bacterium]